MPFTATTRQLKAPLRLFFPGLGPGVQLNQQTASCLGAASSLLLFTPSHQIEGPNLSHPPPLSDRFRISFGAMRLPSSEQATHRTE